MDLPLTPKPVENINGMEVLIMGTNNGVFGKNTILRKNRKPEQGTKT